MATGALVRQDAVLETRQLSVSYGGVDSLADVDLRVGVGEIVGLIGPNGAGKTTMIDALSGFVRPKRGRIEFLGHEINTWPAHRRARSGLTRTFQSIESFEPLTVRANLLAAGEAHRRRRPLRDRLRGRGDEVEQRVDTMLGLFALGDVRDAFPPDLPYGIQKLVGLAMALMIEPSVILLDEPAAGLDDPAVAVLTEQLRRLRDDGLGLLLVDHDMDLVFDLCDRVYVLDFGRLIFEGEPEAVRSNERVRIAYLGTPAPTGGAAT